MNSKEAKNISIVDLLANMGIHSKTEKKGIKWYNSPLRNENSPSFKVDCQKNIWYDFGIGKGGTIIDLVLQLYRTDITGALKILQSQNFPIHKISFFEQQKLKPSKLIVNKIGSLQNQSLIHYLVSRGISLYHSSSFVKEAYYQIGDNNYFAIAFKNDTGGYELRNEYFKGSSSPKAITTIKGFSKAINIFEGFFDFLTALEYYNLENPANTTIVLNSTAHIKYVEKIIQKYGKVNLFLDNDEAGSRAANVIKQKHKNVENISQQLYPKFNDFNEFWIKLINENK